MARPHRRIALRVVTLEATVDGMYCGRAPRCPQMNVQTGECYAFGKRTPSKAPEWLDMRLPECLASERQERDG